MDNSSLSHRSLLSLVLILGTLFLAAFVKMEGRRLSYELLILNRELKKTVETRRILELKKLSALRPQKIEKEIQSRTAYSQADASQIVHLPNSNSSLSNFVMESPL